MNVPAGEFKAHCLQLMDNVKDFRQEIVITKFGRPVAKLVPVEEQPKASPFGFLKDSVVIKSDIIAPIGEKWDANT